MVLELRNGIRPARSGFNFPGIVLVTGALLAVFRPLSVQAEYKPGPDGWFTVTLDRNELDRGSFEPPAAVDCNAKRPLKDLKVQGQTTHGYKLLLQSAQDIVVCQKVDSCCPGELIEVKGTLTLTGGKEDTFDVSGFLVRNKQNPHYGGQLHTPGNALVVKVFDLLLSVKGKDRRGGK